MTALFNVVAPYPLGERTSNSAVGQSGQQIEGLGAGQLPRGSETLQRAQFRTARVSRHSSWRVSLTESTGLWFGIHASINRDRFIHPTDLATPVNDMVGNTSLPSFARPSG